MAIAFRQYLAQLPAGKLVLWCYLIWYLVTVVRYFDPAPAIWLNSLGISVVIGFALLLSVSTSDPMGADRWQTVRLFLMPFCVSSFSSLIKDRGFILVAPPSPNELAISVGSCMTFVFLVFAVKAHARRSCDADSYKLGNRG
jgi:hypothetical protein